MNERESSTELGSRPQLNAEKQTPGTPRTPTTAQLKLAAKAAEIKVIPHDDGPSGYLATCLVKCTLPHKDPGNVPVWTRKNGGENGETLVVQPGWDVKKSCSTGYPYGALPRLILIWMVSEAKIRKDRRIKLGDSFAEFARKLEIGDDSRGKRSMARNLQKQLQRLLKCHISFHRGLKGVYSEAGTLRAMEGYELENAAISSKNALWWDVRNPDGKAFFESWIELSPDFFAAIMKSAVPFRIEAISMLKSSALAIDLYILCCYLTEYIDSKKLKSHALTWEYLADQLGCHYASNRELSRKVRVAMRKVQAAYPTLRIKYMPHGGGMVVQRSPLAVKRRSERRTHSATAS